MNPNRSENIRNNTKNECLRKEVYDVPKDCAKCSIENNHVVINYSLLMAGILLIKLCKIIMKLTKFSQ